MKIEDETLMAYADGELEAGQRAEIEAAIAKDPELARRIEQHRALRSTVARVFDPVIAQPVPPALEAAARGDPAARAARGNVVRFPARASRPPATPWRAREWLAMAASLLLGVFLSWRFLAPAGEIALQGDSLVARGELARALDATLASEQGAEAPVSIGISFLSRDGAWCRGFVSRGSSTAGLACREGADWRIPVTQSVDVQQGDFRQAGSLPPAILAAIEERLSGEPLDAQRERQARDAGWTSPGR